MCEWLVDNNLSATFDEDKTKCILFRKEKNIIGAQHKYEKNRIKQFRIVECLACYLDANLKAESMTMKFLKKINTKLQFL